MTDDDWSLDGVEPRALERAAEEAVRRGLSLADYLTDVLLQSAIATHVRAGGAGETTEITEIADVRDRLSRRLDCAEAAAEAAARQAEAAAAHVLNELRDLRESLEKRLADSAEETRTRLRGEFAAVAESAAVLAERVADGGRTQAQLTRRMDALSARMDDEAETAHEAHKALRAETERVEACTLAALEKLSGDMAAGDAAAEARLDLLNGAVTALVAGVTPSNERLARLEHEAASARSARAAALELARRVSELDQQQARAFETLRADMAQFVADNGRRLAALESGFVALEPNVLAEQFANLRKRIEERIAGVEQRSVRVLEQTAETIAMLDKRLAGPEHAAAKSA